MTEQELITRREAILRVTALLGGVALVGGSALLTGCRPDANSDAPFTADEVAFLDEVADTILPRTSTPGAKDAQTGAFMAMMVRDTYSARDRKIFRDGMRAIDDASRKAHNVPFMQATPQQRLAVLEPIDRDQKAYSDTIKLEKRTKDLAYLTDQRQEAAPGAEVGPATAVTQDKPTHYFRMMKELALLGFFTSEIGATQALRYVESPGRFEPCVPYTPGEKAWAPHA
jgi:glucoside 3-dehydrogenase (cytochrome c) hitch-hiker subunit